METEKTNKQVGDSIRRQSAILIVQEIEKKGRANVARLEACIKKVKEELGIDLEISPFNYLVFSKKKNKKNE